MEAEPLIALTEAKTSSFIWNNINCDFRIPYALVIDNGKQFNNERYWKMCVLKTKDKLLFLLASASTG